MAITLRPDNAELLSPADQILLPARHALHQAVTADMTHAEHKSEAEATVRGIPDVYKTVERAFSLANARAEIARAEIMSAVHMGQMTDADGLRALAHVASNLEPGVSLSGINEQVTARLATVNSLLSVPEGEPVIIILPSGYTHVEAGGFRVVPHIAANWAGANIVSGQTGDTALLIGFADMTKGEGGQMATTEVVAGLREIGNLLRRNDILSGRTPNGGASDFNQVARAVGLLGMLSRTGQDLHDFGFTKSEIGHVKRLWTDLATAHTATRQAVNIPELMVALPVIDREGAVDHMLESLNTIGARLFAEMATDGVGFLGYRRRLLALYEAIHGPLNEAGRQQALREVAQFALLAATTPDKV